MLGDLQRTQAGAVPVFYITRSFEPSVCHAQPARNHEVACEMSDLYAKLREDGPIGNLIGFMGLAWQDECVADFTWTGIENSRGLRSAVAWIGSLR